MGHSNSKVKIEKRRHSQIMSNKATAKLTKPQPRSNSNGIPNTAMAYMPTYSAKVMKGLNNPSHKSSRNNSPSQKNTDTFKDKMK
jgi:hypothetical protein